MSRERVRRALLLAAGLILAGLPPAATWLGKGLLEAGATGLGHIAVIALVLVVSVLTAATVVELAVTRPDDASVPRPARSPAVLVAAGALLVVTIALGVVPGLTRSSLAAAGRFTDRPAYVAAVLATPAPPASSPATTGLGATPAVLGAVAAVGRRRVRCDPRPGPGPTARPAAGAGRSPGSPRCTVARSADSVAWITFGAADDRRHAGPGGPLNGVATLRARRAMIDPLETEDIVDVTTHPPAPARRSR